MIHNISRFIAALALLATAQGVWADTETVSYVDADGNAQTITATVERSATIDLTDAPGDFNAIEGDVLTGTTSHTVTIAADAGITLSGATISGGIVCEGTATITLVGTNSVNVNNVSASSMHKTAGIQIGGSGTTLTIRGDGSLTATGGSQAAGIGLGRTWDASVTAGVIVIEGGTVNASGDIGIGIGTVGNSQTATIDGISIKGGTVSASLGKGYIYNGCTATVGYIKIYDTIDMVDASKITESVTYMHDDTDVTASASDYFTIIENGNRRIIVPKDDNDYTITIADGIEHGTLTVAAATAKYMQTVTVTATPAFGYRFVRLIVKDAQNNDVASTGNTFQMPKGGATVSAVFEQGTHGTTEFVWGYPGPDSFVNEATIYDGVTTVNIQNTEVSYNILKNEEYTYSKFLLDNNTYDANIPYAGGTGEFYGAGNGTNFAFDYDGETGYYDITMTDVGNGKWSVSILKTVGQMDVVPDQTYTGSAITPEPLVIAGSLSLTKGTDYVYSYTNNTNVGTATVTVTFQGDYESLGSVEKEFTIAPWSGSGIASDPFIIENPSQLLLLAHRVNGTNGETANTYQGKYFKLGADIMFSHPANETDDYAENYEAIGTYIGGTNRYFNGNFDGDGHTVSGIRIRKTGSGNADNYQGLFGCISSGANIHDVHLTDARIKGYNRVGGIVGAISVPLNGSGVTVSGCSVTDSYITATSSSYGIICGSNTSGYSDGTLRNNYYHGCTVNGTAVTSGVGCGSGNDLSGFSIADITANNGALPAYRLDLGENITTPPGTFVGQTGWLDTPPVSPRLAPENGFTLAGNHYFASGYEFTPGSTLASGAAQGYTPRATLGGQLLDPYTPTGDADPLAGTAIAQFTVNADCDGKTLASTQAIYSTGQPVTVAYINADGTAGEASAIALDGTESSLAAGTYFAGLENVNFDHTVNLTGNVNLILKDGCTMNVGESESRISGHGIRRDGGEQSLTIYSQSLGDDMGALSVYTDNGKNGIVAYAVTINGGNVTIDSNGDWATGIYAGNDDITINGGNVSVTAPGTNAWAIYANRNVTINGGTVNASGTADGIRIDNGTIAINGGTVNASGSYGINAGYGDGTITLGWTNATDRITASSYSGIVAVADGQALTDGSGNIYTGTLTAATLAALAGKTLSGITEVTLTEDNATQVLAAINGMSGIGVTFNRAFTASKPSTICLPFDYTKKEGDGSFYAFTSIEHSGSKYIATMTEPGTETLTANTPYLYLPSATGNVEFSGTPTTAIAAGTTTSGDWTFQGTYDEVKWDTAPTGIYGFSAQDVTDQEISQGEFVKVGAKVRIRPLRAYLKYKNGTENYSAAPTRGTTADLPDRIIVRLIGSDGNTTAIGTLDTRTGELEIDTWYDLNGRKLSAKPTHRGIYINNGRKVVIK